jgi:hypothetical protein
MASGRLKGRTFSFGNDRRSAIGLWTRALEADATCTATTNVGTVATTAIPAGTGHIFSFATTAGSNQGVVVACDADVVLAVGHTGETDYMVVPPESTEWYGIISTWVSMSHSGADVLNVQESCSEGSTRTITIPGGGTGAWSQSGYDSQYTGKACKYSAASPFNIHSFADGDGGDAVNMLPTTTGSMRFGASTQFQWLSFASLEPGSCSCTHGDVQLSVCQNGVCKGRIGGGAAGVTCDCTVPMWGVLECQETNDEQLFYGDLSYAWHYEQVVMPQLNSRAEPDFAYTVLEGSGRVSMASSPGFTNPSLAWGGTDGSVAMPIGASNHNYNSGRSYAWNNIPSEVQGARQFRKNGYNQVSTPTESTNLYDSNTRLRFQLSSMSPDAVVRLYVFVAQSFEGGWSSVTLGELGWTPLADYNGDMTSSVGDIGTYAIYFMDVTAMIEPEAMNTAEPPPGCTDCIAASVDAVSCYDSCSHVLAQGLPSGTYSMCGGGDAFDVYCDNGTSCPRPSLCICEPLASCFVLKPAFLCRVAPLQT